jgi:hypothetical protein
VQPVMLLSSTALRYLWHQWHFSEFIACIQMFLAGTKEEWAGRHLVAPCIRRSAQQRHCAVSPRNYCLYYLYCHELRSDVTYKTWIRIETWIYSLRL